MSSIALQILEGHERGRTYTQMPMPITIGREEDNAIRLNDERASRFHAKIQADDDRVILTDLDSTNGTRVNGHPVSMRVLQAGDQILIGRSLIAFWPEEPPATPIPMPPASGATSDEFDSGFGSDPSGDFAANGEGPTAPDQADRHTESGTLFRGGTVNTSGELFPDGPPPLPANLSAAQRAELSDLLSYVQQGLVSIAMTSYSGDPNSPQGRHTVVPEAAWQQFTMVQRSLAEYLSRASTPE